MAIPLEGRNRVTAGLPSLSPQFRHAADTFGEGRDRTAALVEDKESRAKAAVASDGGHITTEWDAQIGRPMMSNDIIRRLRKLNPNFIFERSIACPHVMGIYYPDKQSGKHHLFGFEAGISPEFSVRKKNDKGEFAGEVRGWRTVLMRLIQNRYISGPKAEKAFGLPSRTSRNWQMLTT